MSKKKTQFSVGWTKQNQCIFFWVCVVEDNYNEEENTVGVEVENIQNGVDLTADSTALKDQANEVQTVAAAAQPAAQQAAASSTEDDDDDDDDDDEDDVTDFEEGKTILQID